MFAIAFFLHRVNIALVLVKCRGCRGCITSLFMAVQESLHSGECQLGRYGLAGGISAGWKTGMFVGIFSGTSGSQLSVSCDCN